MSTDININVLKMIVKSGLILEQLGENHPTIKENLYTNFPGTLKLLKAKNCLHLFHIEHTFEVPYNGNDNIKTWAAYREVIKANIAMLCQQLVTKNDTTLLEYFCPAKNELANIIHDKYYNVLPFWPKLNETNTARIDLDIKSSYIYGVYWVIWSCIGSLKVQDERPALDVFKASFEGTPDIKCLVLDKVELDIVEKSLKVLSKEKQKEIIDKYNTDSLLDLEWEKFTKN